MNESPQALFSSWTPRVALFAGALVCTAILLHRLLGMPTPLALNLFAVAFGLAALAILLGTVSLIDVWRRGAAGFAWSMIGIVVAGGIFAWPLSFLPGYINQPLINDITTDVQDAPAFIALASSRSGGANPAAYPVQKLAELQQSVHPDLRPLILSRSIEDTYEIALETIKRMRYQIIAEEAPSGRKPGLIEAVDRTMIVGFYDDVVIRISGDQGRSRIDVRSSSRYGMHDFGRNASRVRRVLTELQTRIDASISGSSTRFARIKSRLDRAKLLAKRGKAGDPKSLDRRKQGGAALSDAQRAPVQKAKPLSRAADRARDKQD